MSKMDSSLFKCQFIIGPRVASTLRGWQQIEINKSLFLTSHPDLEVTVFTVKKKYLLCLGYIFHPEHPDWDNESILRHIVNSANSFSQFEEVISVLSGRWVLYIELDNDSRIYPDTTGSRPIYYSKINRELWIGNQPTIIGETLNLSPDIALIKHFSSKDQPEMWPGTLTSFADIKHMTANHYLDLSDKKIHRFWPSENTIIPNYDAAEAAKIVSNLITGTLHSAMNRYELWVAITGGYDSRVLLAATQSIKSHIQYFTISHPKVPKLDLKIPKKLAHDLKLRYKVIQQLTPDEKFLKIFDKNVAKMVTGQCRLNAKTYEHISSNAIFAETQGSGIGKCTYYKSGIHPKILTPEYLCKVTRFSKDSATIHEFENWLANAPDINFVNRLDLLFWEQRLGNWNALDFTGQELTRRVFSPFNNRELICTMLGVPIKDRYKSHNLHRHIYKLSLPKKHTKYFNSSRSGAVKKLFKKIIKRSKRILEKILSKIDLGK